MSKINAPSLGEMILLQLYKKSVLGSSIILDPIKNIEKIDSIRRSVGLITLQEYLEFIKDK